MWAGNTDALWLIDNLASFAPHIAAGLVLLTVLSAIRRAPRLAIAFLIVSLIPGSLVVRSFAAAAPVAMCSDPASRLRVVTFNLLTYNSRRAGAVDWLLDQDADVIAVQESHDIWERDLHRLTRTHPYVAHSPSRNTAVYSRLPFAAQPAASGQHLFPRGIGVRLRHREQPLTLLAVHVKKPLRAEDRLQRLDEMSRITALVRRTSDPVIVMGDFNAAPTSLDFTAFLDQAGLRSPGLMVPPLSTWPARFPGLGIQIDHVLASAGIAFEAVRAGPKRGSNHLPVIADLALDARCAA